ncbi:MAG TPA: sigma-54-dependent Fis family transcriptional regulator [Vicinamibacteria bacterium]|nr:sigma-54-dependent Fis family transcriptional regulator [Vicinamibacteria bacterium]
MSDERAGAGAHTEATRDPGQPLGSTALGRERLLALYRISRELLSERAPLAVIDRILSAAVEALGPERACLLAHVPDGAPRPLATRGLDLGPDPEGWPISLSVVRHVAETGLAVLASDIRGDASFKGSASVHRFRIRSVLAVPLGPRPARGVLYLDTQAAERAFTAEDLDFATALAVHAALVLDRVEEHARTAEALARSDERLDLLQAELLRHEIVGRAPALLQAYDALRRFARAGARVLLRGETGTGKELFARAYAAESGRPARGWVPVPIPALAPTLVESELFGHVRGAFTEATRDKKGRLEMADQGVLFLDEIGDVEPALQTKLLRFLDSGELFRVGDTTARRVDALVVSATNRPLEKDVETGRFRADLLARLGHTVVIPPLRERPEDVPLLVEHVLSRVDRGPVRHRFVPETLELLRRHHWPFNVRELQQVVERAVCLVDGEEVRPEQLPDYLCPGSSAPPAIAGPPRPLREVVEAAEKAHVLRVLEHTGGNKRRAIELLGIAPETFYRRLEAWGLHRRENDRD